MRPLEYPEFDLTIDSTQDGSPTFDIALCFFVWIAVSRDWNELGENGTRTDETSLFSATVMLKNQVLGHIGPC